ncbi:hypothetical protein LCGC14_0620620 [marine sediment metagenome]|uniref:Uncharacterized protein n=1 Tax=marine sediment metagenome TaxID=412755 RepID=A0A0F9R9X9_9ZZZZ
MKRIAATLKINDVRMFEEKYQGISSDTVVTDTPELAGVQDVGKYKAAYFANADLLMVGFDNE